MPSCRKYRLPLGSPLPFQLFNQNYQGKRKITLFQNYSLLYSTQHGHIYFECSPGDCMTLYIDEAHRWANKTTMEKYRIQQEEVHVQCSTLCTYISYICKCICCKITFLPQWSLAQFKVVEWRMCEAALALTSLPGSCIFHDYNQNTFFRMGTNISGQNFLFLPDYNWKNTDFLFVGYDAVFV